MTNHRMIPIFIACLLLAVTATVSAQEVRLESKPLVLPTYEIGEPEVNPVFFTGRVYQGAQGHIYPYPLYDVLTDNKVDKTYNALTLENEYVKLCVLPEIGGRILSATDKTNGYDFFYRQNVVKPALIGMLGAWMSGGVEWNIPHHHRPSSFMPIDWKTQENPDGSKTIWVGETEVRSRIKWSVGLTVYPDSSLVEAKVKIMNRSPLIQSFLYWANVSVHCDENYQVIFPPTTQFGTGHSKTDFRRWPIDNGKDITWWKSFTENAASVFAWDFDNDFFAGYDHAKHAGTLHVANHHVVGGKKFFLWGNNPSSFMWEKMLTDDDGQYLELMVGAYSDNQPDYSWIYPGEIREFEQYWYPIRDIKSVKAANKDAAVNLERISSNKVFIGFNTTKAHKDVRVLLFNPTWLIHETTFDIDPATPFTKEIEIPQNLADTDLRIILCTQNGETLIDYQPVELPEIEELPTPVETVKPAAEYETIEELYLTGLRIEQFHNARLNPMDYYNEALRRDPNDSRVNTAVGIRLARQARWEEAETHLRRAVERLLMNYTTPRDNEANYYLGYVLEQQFKFKEAEDQYWKATWSTSYQSAAYLALARLSCCAIVPGAMHEGFIRSLKLVDKSLEVHSRNTQALVTKAFMLGMMNRKEEAKKYLTQTLEIDPLDFWAVVEQAIQDGNLKEVLPRELAHRGAGFVQLQNVLDVAGEYRAFGPISNRELAYSATELGEPFATSPMLHFYAGSGWERYAHGYAVLPVMMKPGVELLPDGCFPSRPDEIKILNAVIAYQHSHPAGYYYLGNLLYYLEQKERAIENWEKAASLDATFGQVLRNLGFAYSQAGETEKAIAAYEKAVALEVVTPRLLVELDWLYEREQTPVAQRLALYEKFEAVVMKHDDAVIRLIAMFNQAGKFDRAIEILHDRHFHVWEGGGEVHRYFVDAHLLAGMKKMNDGDFAGALRDFEMADTYPENLEVGRPSGTPGHTPKVFYFMGKAYQGLGNDAKAGECFETAAQSRRGRRSDASETAFFTGMALQELGRQTDADREINALADAVQRQRESRELIDQYSKFGEDGSRSERVAQLQYLSGLVHLARGEKEQAAREFQTAIKANPDLIWARQFLASP
ncbi:MAG: DUF5107 domain-containing protein [Planctomycetaceae bacterium]|nr:DUF5107 domain-containing protein [Planctomycetaceae bacterium]